MARKSNKKKEDVIILKEEQPMRKERVVLPPRQKPVMGFDAWWMMTQRKFNLDPVMKDAIYKHFRARGFLNNNKFDDGLVDFGILS